MKKKEWTIMVYLAGDNNLSVDMAYAMEQIKSIAGEEANGTNLFVYYDGNSESIPTLYCDFSDSNNPKHVRSYKVPNKLYRVDQKRNENAADFRSVLNFVDWCLNKVEVRIGDTVKYGRRADRYGLIFSGHSLGFEDPGLFKDETSGKTMSMEHLFLLVDRLTKSKAALDGKVHEMDLEFERLNRMENDSDAGRRRQTVLVGQPLDILGFDSCVMGMLEVGYQFKDSAKTMIASEGSIPSAGWTYAKILGSLARDLTPLDDNQVAERFVYQFIKSQDSYTVGGVSVDMAAWDMSRLPELDKAVGALANTLVGALEDAGSPIYRHLGRLILQAHWRCQAYMFDQNVDLVDFCELLRDECLSMIAELHDPAIFNRIIECCEAVVAAVENVVILSGFSGGKYQYSNGVALFFPWSFVTYKASEKFYRRLEFFGDGAGRSWSGFLKHYLGKVALRPFEDPSARITEAESLSPGRRHRYSSFSYQDDDSAGATQIPIATKIAGQENSKIAGQENSKIAGQENSKIAGQENSKIAGQENSKIAGQENSKIAGQENSKIGSVSPSAFFGSLQGFKNIESRWNVSGFTKKPSVEE